ncbi:MAG: hypothetical protein ABFC18_03250 [Rikenellaceae bacterium]
MKEAIQKIMVSKIQCSGITGIEGIPQSSAEVAEMMKDCFAWYLFKGQFMLRFTGIDHKDHVEKVFNYWYNKIRKK